MSVSDFQNFETLELTSVDLEALFQSENDVFMMPDKPKFIFKPKALPVPDTFIVYHE